MKRQINMLAAYTLAAHRADVEKAIRLGKSPDEFAQDLKAKVADAK